MRRQSQFIAAVEWGVGDVVQVKGRAGLVTQDWRPAYQEANVRWEDTGEEEEDVDAADVQFVRVADQRIARSSSTITAHTLGVGAPGGGCTITETEKRAISLNQLCHLYGHTKHCFEAGEKWTADRPGADGTWKEEELDRAEQATLYDIVKFVVKPCTLERQCSTVELMAAEPQSPDYFTSHWSVHKLPMTRAYLRRLC